MLCRGCNTRYPSGRETCPSCGRRAKTHGVEDGASDSGLPAIVWIGGLVLLVVAVGAVVLMRRRRDEHYA